MKAFQAAILLAPDNLAVHFQFGFALRRMGRLDDAEDAAVHALALNSQPAPAVALVASIARDKGEVERAERYFRRAIGIDPTDRDIAYDILSAYAARSGIPVLINTSFNVHEELIINTPGECLTALREGRIDYVATARPESTPGRDAEILLRRSRQYHAPCSRTKI